MAVVLSELKTEIDTDPVTLGYTGKTNDEVADLLNSLSTGRTKDRGSIETWQILDATDFETDYAVLSSNQKTQYQIMISAGVVSIKSANIKNALVAMFGAGTATRTNLIALAKEPITRAEDLFLPIPIILALRTVSPASDAPAPSVL